MKDNNNDLGLDVFMSMKIHIVNFSVMIPSILVGGKSLSEECTAPDEYTASIFTVSIWMETLCSSKNLILICQKAHMKS
jgi:hypothetical protein